VALTVSGNSKLAATLGEAYRLSGFQGFLRTWAEYDSKNAMSGLRPYEVARRFVLMGKKNEALDWLQKAFTERSAGIVRLKVDPVFDPLRSDPGFQALVQKLNFPK